MFIESHPLNYLGRSKVVQGSDIMSQRRLQLEVGVGHQVDHLKRTVHPVGSGDRGSTDSGIQRNRKTPKPTTLTDKWQ